jgi:hypothetical protein
MLEKIRFRSPVARPAISRCFHAPDARDRFGLPVAAGSIPA